MTEAEYRLLLELGNSTVALLRLARVTLSVMRAVRHGEPSPFETQLPVSQQQLEEALDKFVKQVHVDEVPRQ